jgi:multiple sugar transport system permease protein
MKRNPILRIFWVLGLVFIITWSLAPVLVGFTTSISTQAEISSIPTHWWPANPTLASYRALLLNEPQKLAGMNIGSEYKSFGKSMVNSIVVTIESVIVMLVTTVLAAYAFARLRFPGRLAFYYSTIGTLILPLFVLVAPLFQLIAKLGWMDTQIGLVTIYFSALAPLALWLFYNFVREIPIEPEEAALMDGCNHAQAFFQIVLPQMRSAIAALTAILLLSVWGQFLIPLLFAPTLNTKPVTVLITEFVGKYARNVPMISAAGMLALLPPAIVAIILNRHIRGVLSGWGG